MMWLAGQLGKACAQIMIGGLILFTWNFWAKAMYLMGWLDLSWLKEALR